MDYHPDYTDVCDDKAISSYASEFHKTSCSNITGIHEGPASSSRRVLLEMLMKDEIDIKKIYEIIQSRRVPDD